MSIRLFNSLFVSFENIYWFYVYKIVKNIVFLSVYLCLFPTLTSQWNIELWKQLKKFDKGYT